MSVLKDKNTGRMIAFNHYDQDVTVTNSLARIKTVRNGIPADILSRNEWNLSRTCQRITSFEDIEINNPRRGTLPDKNKYAGGKNKSNRYNCRT